MHFVENVFKLYLDLYAHSLAFLFYFRADGVERLCRMGKVDDHHHIEIALDDGLADVKNVDLTGGKICAYAGDDSHGILADYSNDSSCHFLYNAVKSLTRCLLWQS